jgi:hypothetical protein
VLEEVGTASCGALWFGCMHEDGRFSACWEFSGSDIFADRMKRGARTEASFIVRAVARLVDAIALAVVLQVLLGFKVGFMRFSFCGCPDQALNRKRPAGFSCT